MIQTVVKLFVVTFYSKILIPVLTIHLLKLLTCRSNTVMTHGVYKVFFRLQVQSELFLILLTSLGNFNARG